MNDHIFIHIFHLYNSFMCSYVFPCISMHVPMLTIVLQHVNISYVYNSEEFIKGMMRWSIYALRT